jgi:hypothetical protein
MSMRVGSGNPDAAQQQQRQHGSVGGVGGAPKLTLGAR